MIRDVQSVSALCKRFKSNSSFRRIVKIFLRILAEGTGPVGFDSLPEALEPLSLPLDKLEKISFQLLGSAGVVRHWVLLTDGSSIWSTLSSHSSGRGWLEFEHDRPENLRKSDIIYSTHNHTAKIKNTTNTFSIDKAVQNWMKQIVSPQLWERRSNWQQ